MTDLNADVVVIGAGVVGLATAAALAAAGRDVLLLERHGRVGAETSSRSSEVIHAGLYYPPGSWKARLCVAGRDRLYALLAEAGIAHRRIGKLIVAPTPAAEPALQALCDNAAACGAGALVPLDGAAVRRLEPAVQAVAGLLSPATGIVDSHGLMAHLLMRLRAAGGTAVMRQAVVRLEPAGVGLRVHTDGAAGPARVRCRVGVLAAGLDGDRLLRGAGIGPDVVPDHVAVKGEYFGLRRAPVSRLVYPLPPPGGVGLGVHVTLDLGGQARLGPNVVHLSREEAQTPGALDVDPGHAADFLAAARTYLPALSADDLVPGYAGLRPRLSARGFADFVVRDLAQAGTPGLIALCGIESPGLTAALALADEVRAQAAVYF